MCRYRVSYLHLNILDFWYKIESKYQNSQMLRRQSRNRDELKLMQIRHVVRTLDLIPATVTRTLQLQTLGRVSACLKERMVATEQMIMMRMEVRNTECSTRSLAEMLGTRQLLIWSGISVDILCYLDQNAKVSTDAGTLILHIRLQTNVNIKMFFWRLP